MTRDLVFTYFSVSAIVSLILFVSGHLIYTIESGELAAIINTATNVITIFVETLISKHGLSMALYGWGFVTLTLGFIVLPALHACHDWWKEKTSKKKRVKEVDN